jgi:uncharacterized membrane protein
VPPIVIATLVVFFALLATLVYFVRQGMGAENRRALARADALIDAIREEAYAHAEIDHTLSTAIRKMIADYKGTHTK